MMMPINLHHQEDINLQQVDASSYGCGYFNVLDIMQYM